ncbi:MAG: ATP-binding cassette domain-containing protein [Solirubrobacteraceae bacterium]|nr:ATP-binding cassette domain-containing protein [Solirubrobacteraceae bacterium]
MSETTDRVELRLTDVHKAFGGVRALKGVSLAVRAGEVHALLGENGAGKSTLMAIAAGSLAPDAGTVEIGGAPLTHTSPSAAQALGLAVVYQHPAIADDLTVLENMLLAMPAGRRPRFGAAERWAREQLDAVGARIDPHRRAADLTAAEHQLVEIAKALALEPRVLILDEPTAALGAAEVDHLFEQVRAIRDRGTAVVYISHRIPEVTEISDRLTVLRDGEHRGTFPTAELSEDDILDLIVGRRIDAVFPDKGASPGDEVLRVEGLSGEAFDDVSLRVRAGEIVGLAGVVGNGQQELVRALAGLEPHTGAIRVNGRDVRIAGPVDARRAGIAFVPADRQREGLFGSLSVRENAAATSLDAYARGGLVRPSAERAAVAAQSAALAVKAPSPEAGVMTLSGGNQQKVVFARALLSDPDVLLCDEPTQGVDVGARVEIYALIRELADAGKAVVVCSSDALELEGLCDRVVILSRGSVVAELTGDEITEAAITGAAVTASGARRTRGTEGGAAPRAAAARTGALARLLRGDNVAVPIVALMIVLLAIVTTTQDSAFLGAFNVDNLLLLSTALILVSLGQLIVLLTAGVDLSVGPMMGLGLVVLTSFATDERGTGGFVAGFVLLLLTGLAVGAVNGALVRLARIPPVIATLATFIAIQGVALILNPVPEGLLAMSASETLRSSIGGLVPWAFAVAVALAVGLELALRRRRVGMALRAVGSSEATAHRIGVRVGWTVFGAYVACGLFAALASVMLAVQIGTGDATAGQAYTLQSIAAVVVGGASIFGGRGSFLGALLGALLLTEVINALPFLQLGNAWQFWVPGGVVLIAAALFARAERADRRAAQANTA